MSTKYISWAFEQADLVAGPRFVLVALADIANDDGWAWPGTRFIGAKTGMHQKTVSRHIKALEDKGKLSVESRSGHNGNQTTNGYQLWLSPPPQIEGGGEQSVQPQGQSVHSEGQSVPPPTLRPGYPPPRSEAPPPSDRGAIEEPSSYPSSLTVNGTGRDEAATALPPWFQYLTEIDGANPARPEDYPVTRAWADRKGYSDELLEAVAEDLKAKWGTPQSAKRPWPYTDVRATFQKWCRLEAESRGEPPQNGAPTRTAPGPVTRGDAGIWAKALEILEHELPRPTFKTWLEGTVGVGYAGNTLVVGVANEYVGESLVERMYSKLTSVLRDLGAANVEIAFQVHETVEVS